MSDVEAEVGFRAFVVDEVGRGFAGFDEPLRHDGFFLVPLADRDGMRRAEMGVNEHALRFAADGRFRVGRSGVGQLDRLHM